eukprot:scaffold11608_cov62-Phaeocystis_antarctica.AAC.2
MTGRCWCCRRATQTPASLKAEGSIRNQREKLSVRRQAWSHTENTRIQHLRMSVCVRVRRATSNELGSVRAWILEHPIERVHTQHHVEVGETYPFKLDHPDHRHLHHSGQPPEAGVLGDILLVGGPPRCNRRQHGLRQHPRVDAAVAQLCLQSAVVC